jgi:hypothetical protein
MIILPGIQTLRLKKCKNKAKKYVLDKQLRIYLFRLSPPLERQLLLFPPSSNLTSDNLTEFNFFVHNPPISYQHVKLMWILDGCPIFAF